MRLFSSLKTFSQESFYEGIKMKEKTLFMGAYQSITKKISQSKIYYAVFCFCLSWIYALCSQVIISLPFNYVPISLQPLPIFLLSFFLGWPAVHAYGLYYLQGTLGLPIFAGTLGGFSRILGPTGGYLIGFGLSSLFIVLTRHSKPSSKLVLFAKIQIAILITFLCGLAQLWLFVPSNMLLQVGFFPFLIGDFIVKAGILYFTLVKRNLKS